MGPINYLPQEQGFGNDLLQALQLGAAAQKMRLERQQQAEAEQYKTDLMGALQTPDPQALITLTAKYPKHGEGLKQAWGMMAEEQRKAELGVAQQAWYAINSGRPDVAVSVLDRQIDGVRNAGKDVAKLTALRDAIKMDPASAGQNMGLFIATVAPKEFAESVTKLNKDRREQEEQPGKLARQDIDNRRAGAEAITAESTARYSDPKARADAEKATADAATAAVTSRFSESNAVKDLEKKGWDIKKIQEDIKIAKINSQIAAANVAVGREGNAIRRDELKLKRDELKLKRDEQVRTVTADAQSARSAIDNALNTADRILANPSLNSVVGSFQGRMPALLSDEANDAIRNIETLGSQVFLAQLPMMKGMGELTEAEGAKLERSFQNLSRVQSEKQFRENLGEAQRLLLKARKNVALKYGIPDNVPDTPAAGTGAAGRSVDLLLKKYAP